MLIASVVLYLLVTNRDRSVGGDAGEKLERLRRRRPQPAPLHEHGDGLRHLFGAKACSPFPVEFSKSGLGGIVRRSFGSSVCLVIVALLSARAF